MIKARAPIFRNEFLLLGLFVFVFALMSILSPGQFLKPFTIQSMAFQLPEFGILTLAQMVIIITGGINLSISYTAALSSIVGSVLIVSLNAAHVSPVLSISLGILVMLGIATLGGLFNGTFVALVGVSPILVTLGTMTLFDGLSLLLTRGAAISGYPFAYLWFGNGTIFHVPVPMLIFVLVLIVTYYVINRTSFGMKLFMIGANPTATVFSGVNVKRVLFGLYIYSALLSGLAGVIMSSRYNSAKESYGSSYLLQSVVAAVLGGTDIVGGAGSVFGVVLAVMILQVVSTGLDILGFNRFLTNVIMGLILIGALSLNVLGTSRAQRLAKSRTSAVVG